MSFLSVGSCLIDSFVDDPDARQLSFGLSDVNFSSRKSDLLNFVNSLIESVPPKNICLKPIKILGQNSCSRDEFKSVSIQFACLLSIAPDRLSLHLSLMSILLDLENEPVLCESLLSDWLARVIDPHINRLISTEMTFGMNLATCRPLIAVFLLLCARKVSDAVKIAFDAKFPRLAVLLSSLPDCASSALSSLADQQMNLASSRELIASNLDVLVENPDDYVCLLLFLASFYISESISVSPDASKNFIAISGSLPFSIQLLMYLWMNKNSPLNTAVDVILDREADFANLINKSETFYSKVLLPALKSAAGLEDPFEYIRNSLDPFVKSAIHVVLTRSPIHVLDLALSVMKSDQNDPASAFIFLVGSSNYVLGCRCISDPRSAEIIKKVCKNLVEYGLWQHAIYVAMYLAGSENPTDENIDDCNQFIDEILLENVSMSSKLSEQEQELLDLLNVDPTVVYDAKARKLYKKTIHCAEFEDISQEASFEYFYDLDYFACCIHAKSYKRAVELLHAIMPKYFIYDEQAPRCLEFKALMEQIPREHYDDLLKIVYDFVQLFINDSTLEAALWIVEGIVDLTKQSKYKEYTMQKRAVLQEIKKMVEQTYNLEPINKVTEISNLSRKLREIC